MKSNATYWFKENIGIVPFLLALLPLHYMFGFLDAKLPNYILLVLYLAIPLYYLVKGVPSIDSKWLVFILYLPVALVFAGPPSVFRSWERYILFFLLFLSVSPLIQSRYARKFRYQLLVSCFIVCAILSVGSFICFFLGINYFSMDEGGGFQDHTGWFSGLTHQSMTLGPISGIAAIVFFYLACIKNLKTCWTFFVASIGAMIFATSRIAFAATIVGLCAFMYIISKNKRKIIGRLIFVGGLLIIISTYWGNATEAMINKHGELSSTTLFSSRSDKLQARWDEFCSSPIYGVGFASIDPHGADVFNRESGTIEPGSSWMAVLSMTGIIGFAMFLYLMVRIITKTNLSENNALLFSLVCFFAVHMLAEGYIFAAGNPMTFILWLVIGCSVDRILTQQRVQ